MTFIQTGQQWHFSSELALEEVVWQHLPALLNVKPLRRQFSVEGKVCDLLAANSAGELVIIELKNTEDRYIAQQLTRYYDALKHSEDLPFAAETTHPHLIAIAPSFHDDTHIDCRYSTLEIELLSFRLSASAADLTLSLHDASGSEVSRLLLPDVQSVTQLERELPEPPRKLLNWLSHSSASEYDWVMQLRKQLLSFDPRMKEVVTSTSIFYGRGKTKACCELRKRSSDGPADKTLAYFLWLPYPERRRHVIRMMVNFNLEQQQIRQLLYCRHSYRVSEHWTFPDRPNFMGELHGMPCFQEHYLALLNARESIDSADFVELALQTLLGWLYAIPFWTHTASLLQVRVCLA